MLAIREPSKRSRSNYPPTHQGISVRQNGIGHFEDFFDSVGPPAMFSQDPFGSMNRMMNKMSQMANEMFSHFEDMSSVGMPAGPGPQFYSSTVIQSSKYDSNGRPIVEKYKSEAKGFLDDRGLIGERKQAYANTGTGLEKYGHERMIGDKGRKVVKEKHGDYQRTSDVYKNMGELDAQEFDREFAKFFNSNALPAPTGHLYGRNRIQDERKVDDARRGDFIPSNWKAEYQPVRKSDIQPTVPAQRAPARPQALPAPPRRPVQRVAPGLKTPAPGA
jgi:Myelodysplasia-myeloid leukemia factor 1-interacting protein